MRTPAYPNPTCGLSCGPVERLGQTDAVDVATVELLSATLAVMVAVATVAIWLIALSGRGRAVIDLVVDSRATITALLAGGATLGSLYFSEVAGYIPCRLCWFQRIAMYPIAVIGIVWMIRGGREIRWHVVTVAALGGLLFDGVARWCTDTPVETFVSHCCWGEDAGDPLRSRVSRLCRVHPALHGALPAPLVEAVSRRAP